MPREPGCRTHSKYMPVKFIDMSSSVEAVENSGYLFLLSTERLLVTLDLHKDIRCLRCLLKAVSLLEHAGKLPSLLFPENYTLFTSDQISWGKYLLPGKWSCYPPASSGSLSLACVVWHS